jgi:hypothetical protein
MPVNTCYDLTRHCKWAEDRLSVHEAPFSACIWVRNTVAQIQDRNVTCLPTFIPACASATHCQLGFQAWSLILNKTVRLSLSPWSTPFPLESPLQTLGIPSSANASNDKEGLVESRPARPRGWLVFHAPPQFRTIADVAIVEPPECEYGGGEDVLGHREHMSWPDMHLCPGGTTTKDTSRCHPF